LNQHNQNLKNIIEKTRVPLGVCILVLIVMLVKTNGAWGIDYYGIYPRQIEGLIGIITAPFIHGSWGHLFSNIAPLFALLFFVEILYSRSSLLAICIIYLLTGGLVWMFGRASYHIGASGVVYGLLSFLFWSGIFRANRRSIFISLFILALYGGYFAGLLPKEGVSWESHLLGALAGIFVSFLVKNVKEYGEEEAPSTYGSSSQQAFLPADTFTLTKVERWYIEQERLRLLALEQERLRLLEEEKEEI
jgi:membrane associated rhomboid family serine protease